MESEGSGNENEEFLKIQAGMENKTYFLSIVHRVNIAKSRV